MNKTWLSWLIVLLLSSQALSVESKSNPKAEKAPAKPITVYKGEQEEAFIAPEAKYSGQVFTSDLYHGDMENPDYSPATDRSLHDGFYLGAAAGYDSYKIRNSIDITSGGSTLFQQNPDLNAVGGSYTLLGGVGKYFDEPLYMGIELFYNYTRANSTNNVGDGGIDYYVKSVVLTTYGASLLPGIKLSDSTLFYLRGGYSRLDMKTFETSTALNINNAQSNGVNGIHFGLGLETVIYRSISLRGEYTHTNNKNFQTKTGTIVNPTNNQVMLALLFHFV